MPPFVVQFPGPPQAAAFFRLGEAAAAGFRAQWDLPYDYPIVAPAYSRKRQELAKKIGLGRKPKGS
jgi:predicted transcriptional regulator